MMMFGFGTSEMLVAGVICLLLFGHRLPSAMKSLGSSLRSFQQGLREDEKLPL